MQKTDIFQPNRTVPNPSNEGSFPSLLISAKLIYGNIVRRRSAPQITAKCKLRIFRAPTDCAISAAIYENRKIVRARLIGVAANGHCDRGRPQRERVIVHDWQIWNASDSLELYSPLKPNSSNYYTLSYRRNLYRF